MRRYIYAVILSLSLVGAQGIFTTHPYGILGTQKNLSASISLGDLDQDGDLDIVVANGRHWAEQNLIYFNDGRGFFRRSVPLGGESNTTYQVSLADIDNDDDLDALVANDLSLIHI